MVKKIAIVGPESSGKTALAIQLSEHFNAPLVEEYAREYLLARKGIYHQKDLIEIAKGQLKLEAEALQKASNLVICDTNLLVIKIWSLFKYNKCAEEINTDWNKSNYDLQLLLRPDLVYQEDPLRENPSIEDREMLFQIYENELKNKNATYSIIEGKGKERINNALKEISKNIFL